MDSVWRLTEGLGEDVNRVAVVLLPVHPLVVLISEGRQLALRLDVLEREPLGHARQPSQPCGIGARSFRPCFFADGMVG